MDKGDIVEHHGKGRHSAAAWKKVVIAQQRGKSSYAISPFSTHVCCCAMSNFSTLLHYIYFFHASGRNVVIVEHYEKVVIAQQRVKFRHSAAG